jgi:hypothetical protein
MSHSAVRVHGGSQVGPSSAFPRIRYNRREENAKLFFLHTYRLAYNYQVRTAMVATIRRVDLKEPLQSTFAFWSKQ